MPKVVASKQDWVKLGYKLFSQQGISGIVIEKMAKTLKCNKSSFYWHFKTKKDFIDVLVQHWVETETNKIISYTEHSKTPQEKFDLFLTIAFKSGPYMEFIFFLKKYATKHPHIQAIIDNVNKKRIHYGIDLFRDLGMSEEESTVKASIFYRYLIGYHETIQNKKQPKDYLTEVKKELNYFLDI